jgi:hypothetical protein
VEHVPGTNTGQINFFLFFQYLSRGQIRDKFVPKSMHTGMLFVPNLSPGHIFGTDFGTSGDRNGVTFVPGTCPQKMSPGTNSGQKNSPGDDFGTDFVTRGVFHHYKKNG